MPGKPKPRRTPPLRPRAQEPAKLTYLEIPSNDPATSAEFYRRSFGWITSPRPNGVAFEDTASHLIGRWTTEREASGRAGVHVYLLVESVEETLQRAIRAGGSVVREPFREGKLKVASLLDPSGNLVGVWQD